MIYRICLLHPDKAALKISATVSLKRIADSMRGKNKERIEATIQSLNIKNSSIELIDKSILYFAINEMLFGELDKPITIDESLRLSKKFSSPDSYKFINASLDKFLKAI